MVNTTNTLQGYAGVVLTNRRRGSKSRKMYLKKYHQIPFKYLNSNDTIRNDYH